MLLRRRLLLLAPLSLAPLALAACGGDGPPRVFTPLRYDYLTPLRLNVATIEMAPLPPPSPLDASSPAPAAQAVQQLIEDRLSAAGSSGRAVAKIDEARIARIGNVLEGTVSVRIDVITADGGRAGFTEARVTRRLSGFGRDLRGGLYDITKQMLDDMNVELEFQIRQSLRDYLQTTTTAPAPAPVQQQDLSAPSL